MNKFIQFIDVNSKSYILNTAWILTIEPTDDKTIYIVRVKDYGSIKITNGYYQRFMHTFLNVVT